MTDLALDILLVDDNRFDIELALRAFRKYIPDARVEVVKDGAAAVALLLGDGAGPALAPALHPRLVLLDLNLPKLSGLEVLARLRADPRTAKLPVVLMTSSREDRDIDQAYKLGANSYVVKPLEYKAFAEAIREVVVYWTTLNREPPP